MHRQTLVALSWCLVISAAAVLILEVHRSHETVPAPVVAPSFVVNTAATETTATASGPAVRGAALEPQSLPYSANTKTGKFHRETCRHFSCPNCTAKFATREEAIAGGYRPGGCCNP
jgi:hypothetical protein